MRWLQCLIRKWSCVNHQFQFHAQIAYKPTYMTRDLCYLLMFIIGTDIKFNPTNSAIHSSGHSRGPFTSASDYASAQWRVLLHNLFSTCQQVLGQASHIWYSLWLKSLTHNHSTCASPVRVHCVTTGMYDRKRKGRASVPKHWNCLNGLKKYLQIFDHWLKCMTCWCVTSLRWCRKMAVHKCCLFYL